MGGAWAVWGLAVSSSELVTSSRSTPFKGPCPQLCCQSGARHLNRQKSAKGRGSRSSFLFAKDMTPKL